MAAPALQGARGAALRDTLLRHGGAHLLAVDPGKAVSEVQAHLAGAGDVESVCVIGTDADVPMARVTDPANKDEAILTDNFFGRVLIPDEDARYTGDLLPDIPVSRIPSLDPQLVARLLQVGGSLHASWEGAAAVSADVWRGASQAVHEGVARGAGVLKMAPPSSEDEVRALLATDPGRVYFNVHGSDQEPVWYGEGGGRFLPVLRADAIRVRDRAVVVSEACYGAAFFPGEASIGVTFLERGAGAFVGSTIIAWGPAEPPPGLADRIVLGFFGHLDAGEPAARALLLAKEDILNDALASGEPLGPAAHNTMLSFVLYGAPDAHTAAPRPAAPRATAAFTGKAIQHGAARGGSTLASVRARMAGDPGGDSSALGGARARLRTRLPPSTWRALSSGRVTLAELSPIFRSYDQIASALKRALGIMPTECDVFRYRSGPAERACVTGIVREAWGRRRAMVLVDGDGTVLESYLARGIGR